MRGHRWGVMSAVGLDCYPEEDARALAAEDPDFYTLWHLEDDGATWRQVAV